ncbi:MAG TPA: hypothetical protein VGM65_03475 [Candidatus Udaeobacter sp.]
MHQLRGQLLARRGATPRLTALAWSAKFDFREEVLSWILINRRKLTIVESPCFLEAP